MEIGANWELYAGDLSLRTALARTEKYNERNTDIDTANGSYLLSGKHHTDALEFEIAGRITPQWQGFTDIGFLRAVIDQSSSNVTGQLEVGQNPGLSPSRQANLFTHLPNRRQMARGRRLYRRQPEQAGQQRDQPEPGARLCQDRCAGRIPRQRGQHGQTEHRQPVGQGVLQHAVPGFCRAWRRTQCSADTDQPVLGPQRLPSSII